MSVYQSMRQSMAQLASRSRPRFEQAAAWYRQRPRREQRLLISAGGLLGLALIYLVLIEPACSTLTRAQRALPALRTQAATVADLTAQVRALRRQGGGTAPNASPSIKEISSSLQRLGLPEQTWTLTQAPAISVLNAIEGQRRLPGGADDPATRTAITLTLHEASSSALFQWLDTVTRDWRLAIVHAQLDRARQATGRRLPGRINGTVVLLPVSPP